MLDYVIKGGTVVDGTGAAPRPADVGIRGDRIVAVGEVDEPATETIDADGQIVTPGFVDPHTHYDAQLYWDGYATPSSNHGVTSVIGGNCGFTLAPLKAVDADYTRRMMAQVEGMPLEALESGVEWKWETFGEYLDGLEGRIGVNAGFLVGHCALRRYVLGADAGEREATADEVTAMVALLHQSLDAGGLGLSTTRSSTHIDGDDKAGAEPGRLRGGAARPCAGWSASTRAPRSRPSSRAASRGSASDEIELMAQMSAQANRPLNWNVLSRAGRRRPTGSTTSCCRRSGPARSAGRVVALTMPIFADNNMSLGTFCALWLIPGWHDILSLPVPEKTAKLTRPRGAGGDGGRGQGHGVRAAGRLLQLPHR